MSSSIISANSSKMESLDITPIAYSPIRNIPICVVSDDEMHGDDSVRSWDVLQSVVNDTLNRTNPRNPLRVAVDFRGRDLQYGRLGTIEYAVIHFEPPAVPNDWIFLVEYNSGSTQTRNERVHLMNRILQTSKIEKIMHDCRFKSDALIRQYNTELKLVHDTRCWHAIIEKRTNLDLQTVLKVNRLVHDDTYTDRSTGDDYSEAWEARPTSIELIQNAALNLEQLLPLAKLQKQRLVHREKRKRAQDQSQYAVRKLGDMEVEDGLVLQCYPKEFMGPQNKKFNTMVTNTNTVLEKRHDNSWVCWYPSEESLITVKRCMGYQDDE
jgi:hypothetical protein